VLRAGGETETMQENTQDWLQLDEGDPGFQLLTEEEISAMIFYLFLSALFILLHFYLFVSKLGFCLLRLSFASLMRIIG
jgi:hypothetical protein